VINFEKSVRINLEVCSVYIYLLKKLPEKAYYRKWMDDSNELKINQNVPVAYFMLSLQQMKFKMDEKEKLLNVEISKLKLENIKLVRNRQYVNMSVSFD
jgi:hypothetical protein